MKKLLCTVALLCVMSSCAWGLTVNPVVPSSSGVLITAETFPDPVFRAFVTQNYGIRGHGVLIPSVIDNVKEMVVFGAGISSLKGIEYFTSLEVLYCISNDLTELDVSNNKALRTLSCRDNKLTSLNVRGCENLEELYCYNNQLTTLDVSTNTNLKMLSCYNNQLTTLDVSTNTNLKGLYCNNNGLTALDVNTNTNLEELNCGTNNLTTLNLDSNRKLTSLNCPFNNLTELNVDKNTALESISCFSNRIKKLDVSMCPNLEGLICTANELTTLDLSNLSRLVSVDCYFNRELVSLNVSGCSSLRELSCYFCELTELNLTGCSALEKLLCNANKLESLNLDSCRALYFLNCEWNRLTQLNVNKNNRLVFLNCDGNRLTSLDVSACPLLYVLSCSYNNINSINVQGCTSLYRFSCDNNQLKTLNLKACPNLAILTCWGNLLDELDLTANTSLILLDCENNSLTNIMLNSNSLLNLQCYHNQLATLELSNSTSLLHTIYRTDEREAISQEDTVILAPNGKAIASINYPHSNDIIISPQVVRNLDIEERTERARMDGVWTMYGIPFMIFSISDDTAPDGEEICAFPLSSGDHSSLSVPKGSYTQIKNYIIDLGKYVPADKLDRLSEPKGLVLSEVKGFDENNDMIMAAYNTDTGRARLAVKPERLEYYYITGLKYSDEDQIWDYLLRVAIGGTEQTPLALNGHTYRIFNQNMSYRNAKAYCESMGGHLATITTQEELEVVKELLKKASNADISGGRYWLGGESATGEAGTWKWVSDEAFNLNVTEVHPRDGSFMIMDNKNGIRILYPDGDTFTTGLNGTGEVFSLMAQQDTIGEVYLQIKNEGDTQKFSGWYSDYLCGFICEWEPVTTNFAEYSEEYRRYVENPDAYISEGDQDGTIPEATDYSHLSGNPPQTDDTSEPPSVWNTRASGILPPVKHQGDYQTCWTFASLGALEASYTAQGFGSSAPDLSELHMAWYVYKDPRPSYQDNTYTKKLVEEHNNNILYGQGNYTKAANFLARAGTASEADMPYSSADIVEVLAAGKLPEDFAHPVRLKEVYVMNGITEQNRTDIQRLIMKVGAVAVTYDANNSAGLSGSSYYLPSSKGYGHAVILVGWDDDYPRSNFRNDPGMNGAWLVKNSYGENYGDGGYFWMSYAQKMSSSAVFVAGDSRVSKSYGHDTVVAQDSIPYHWSANVFKAEGNDELNEVSFHTRDNNVPYEVYINRLGNESPVNPGIPGTPVASGTIPYAGYHTVTLSTPFTVEAGEYFSVIVKLNTASGSSYYNSTAVEDTGTIRAAGTITTAGKSYFAMDETSPMSKDWQDGKRLVSVGQDRSCNACIRVFSVSGGSTPVTPVTPTPGNNTPGNNPDSDNNSNLSPNNNSGGSGGGGCATGFGILGVSAVLMFIFRRREQ